MTLRVGLAGYGLGGATFHAPLVGATDGLELVAVVTRDPERRGAAMRRHPGIAVVERAEQLWSEVSVDVVVVSTPSGTHAALAMAALEAGCHVVVDKPFARSVAEAQAIRDRAAAVGRLAVPFQNRRWDGDFLTVRELVANETLGQVHRLESRF